MTEIVFEIEPRKEGYITELNMIGFLLGDTLVIKDYWISTMLPDNTDVYVEDLGLPISDYITEEQMLWEFRAAKYDC